jgi:hypothetical protein
MAEEQNQNGSPQLEIREGGIAMPGAIPGGTQFAGWAPQLPPQPVQQTQPPRPHPDGSS